MVQTLVEPKPRHVHAPQHAARQAGERRRFTVPIGVVLSLSFVALTALSGLAVVLALRGSLSTTTGLLRERSEQVVQNVELRLRDHLEPVRAQAVFIAAALIDGRLDPNNEEAMNAWLTAALAATPQVSALSYASAEWNAVRAQHDDDGQTQVVRVDMRNIANVREIFGQARSATTPYWGSLLWSTDLGMPMVNLRVPVRRDGEFVGVVVALVSMRRLSSIVAELSPLDGGSFVLYDRDFVLAHPRLTDANNLLLLPGQVLPRLEQVGDRVLTGLWSPPSERTQRLFGANAENIHIANVDGQEYVYVYRDAITMGGKPVTVGAYFPAQQIDEAIASLRNGAIGAAAALVVALALGILLGRAISRPMVRLETAADEIRDFKFESPPLPRSRFEEIDHANAAVNASREALHWFSTFVPRKLVTRLLAEGETTLQSKRRDVTVMFTDIVGFTMEAEDLPEAETAAFLNEHFAILATCIEEEGGVIDKFIGDAIMATWGAIKRIPDHADCAMAASLAIARALHEDNLKRVAAGRKPVRVRIGMHTGSVVVGNIGAPERINYTVVGDTVNTAQRMEQLGKQYMAADEEVVVLASGATVKALTDPARFADVLCAPAEFHEVRGRSESIEVRKLKLPSPD
ncbi:MAG: adenylate/guanylate cyclase domain-containing protein [Reyranellaceae bacterium]